MYSTVGHSGWDFLFLWKIFILALLTNIFLPLTLYYLKIRRCKLVHHRRKFHNDFIQSIRSVPLSTVRVSKEAKLYKEFKFMEFLLYLWLRSEKMLKNYPKLAKVPSKWWFWESFLNLIQSRLKSRAKNKQIQVLYNFALHFTPQRAQGAYS